MIRISGRSNQYIHEKLQGKGDAESVKKFLHSLDLIIKNISSIKKSNSEDSIKELHPLLEEIELKGRLLLDALNMFSIEDCLQHKENRTIVINNYKDLKLIDPIALKLSIHLSGALSDLKIKEFKQSFASDLDLDQTEELLESNADNLSVELGYPLDIIMPLMELVTAASLAAERTKKSAGNNKRFKSDYRYKWLCAIQFTLDWRHSFKKFPSLTMGGIEDELFGALIRNIGIKVGEGESFVHILTKARKLIKKEGWELPEIIDATDAPFA